MNPKYYNLYNNYIYVCERERENEEARKDHLTVKNKEKEKE